MCFAVYIGTNKTFELGIFLADQTDIDLEKLSDEEETNLRPKFSKTNIYSVAYQKGCCCGLAFDSEDFDDPEKQINKESQTRFIEVIKEMTLTEDIECYFCWEYDWDLPTENTQEIDIREISLGKNYFGLRAKEFIKFRKQTNA